MKLAVELIELLERDGEQTAADAATRLRVTGSTITRTVKALGAEVITVGRGQHTRYARPLFAYSDRAQWPLFWVSATGEVSEFAVASLVKPGVIHVYGSGLNVRSGVDLSWALTPLNLRGFLGRVQRQQLGAVATNWDAKTEQWSVAQRAFAAQSATLDHAGAMVLGEDALRVWQQVSAVSAASDDITTIATHYDALADSANEGRVAGSSADGEQPKFSTRVIDANGNIRDVLVKFSPPRGTPFGERWNDLLRAEAHAATTLADAGFDVPYTRIVSSEKRTYLESARIDRTGARGRKHLLPLSSVHSAFIAGAQQHWPDTVRRLVAQKRLLMSALETTQTLFAFGQLIGNPDMHFGNLGVIAETPEQLARGQFTLAPVYDMLPMRFAPNAHDDFGYTDFTPAVSAAIPDAALSRAKDLSTTFWNHNTIDRDVSESWRGFAERRTSADVA
jgi:HipA-like C-terminal domain